MTKFEVTGCFGCPFFQLTDYSDNDPMYCWVTDEEETLKAASARRRAERADPYNREQSFLFNCPLKEGSVVVELKTKKEENKNG